MLPIVVSAETFTNGAHGQGVHVFGFESEAVDRLMSGKVSLALQIAGFNLPGEEIHVRVIGRPAQTSSVGYAAWNDVPRAEDRNLEFPIILSALAQTGQIPRGHVCGAGSFVGPIDIAIHPDVRDGSYHVPPSRYNEAQLMKPYGCAAILAAFRRSHEIVHSADDLGGHGCLLSDAIASIPGYVEALADEWVVRESLKPDRHEVRHLFDVGGTSESLSVIEEKRMFAEQFLDDPSLIDGVHPAEIDLCDMFDEWSAQHESDGVFVRLDERATPSRVAAEARDAARSGGERRADQAQKIGR